MYLLYKYSNPTTVGSEHINIKEREKRERKLRRVKKRREIEAQRVKHQTLSWTYDELIGVEEQNGKQKRTKRKKQGAGSQPATLDH